MTSRADLIKRVHASARGRGLDEATRRAVYERETGKSTLTVMTEAEIDKVVTALNKGVSKTRRKASEKPYVRLIFALWRSIGDQGGLRDRSTAALKAFVEKQSGVSDPDWLTYAQADPIIRALKAMETRAKEASSSLDLD